MRSRAILLPRRNSGARLSRAKYASIIGVIPMSTLRARSRRVTRRASSRLAGLESRYGSRTHRTFFGPRARQASAATAAESTPPDSPRTARAYPALRVSRRRKSSRRAAAARTSKASSVGGSKEVSSRCAFTRREYAPRSGTVNGARPRWSARGPRVAGGLRGRYNAPAGHVPDRKRLDPEGTRPDDSRNATALRHCDSARGESLPCPERAAHYARQLARNGADQAAESQDRQQFRIPVPLGGSRRESGP